MPGLKENLYLKQLQQQFPELGRHWEFFSDSVPVGSLGRRLWNLGLRVWGLGLGVEGLGVKGLGV